MKNLTKVLAVVLLVASVLCLLPAMEAPVSAASTPYVSFTNISAQNPIMDMWLPFETFKSGGPFTLTMEVKVEGITGWTSPEGVKEQYPNVTTYVEGTKYMSTVKQSNESDGASTKNYATQGNGWKSKTLTFQNVGTINVSGTDSPGNLLRTYFWQTYGTVYIRNVLIKNAAGTVVYNMNTDADLVALMSQMQSAGMTESDISNVASINKDCLWCAPAHFGIQGDYYGTVHIDDGTQTTTTTKKAVLPSKTTTKATTAKPTTAKPTTAKPTTAKPTTAKPTTAKPTTAAPTTAKPTTAAPTTAAPTTAKPTTAAPTTAAPTTATQAPTTAATQAPTTVAPTTAAPTTVKPTTKKPTTKAPTTAVVAPSYADLTINKNDFVPGESVTFILSGDGSNVNFKLIVFLPDGTMEMFENLSDIYTLTVSQTGSYSAVLQSANSKGSVQSQAVTFTVVAPTEAPTTAPTQAPTTAAPTTAAPTVAPTVAPTQGSNSGSINPIALVAFVLILVAGLCVVVLVATGVIGKKKKKD